MWRPQIVTAAWHHHRGDQALFSKRFITLLLVFCGLFTIFFYRAVQVVRYRAELSRMRFLHRACQEKLNSIKSKVPEFKKECNVSYTLDLSDVQPLLKNMTGTKAATGFDNLTPVPSTVFILPHIKNEPQRLLPSYHMKSNRELLDIVIGITHIKRDVDYLTATLKDLVTGISKEDLNSTLLIVLVAESDLNYVLNTSWTIEKEYPEQVKSGLIQVISPSTSYYPNLDVLPRSLGDSPKRFKWRSKEILDVLYLMAYGHTKGSYYLMMEDDLAASKDYMADMKKYVAFCTARDPEWIVIEFSHHFGSIGKLFKSSNVPHFLMYIQLFYHHLPLDHLMENYLKDSVCDFTKKSPDCYSAIMKVRKKYPAPIFQHVGLYSSLAGKIGKVEDPKWRVGKKFIPHSNPLLKRIRCDVKELPYHTLKLAYEGKTMFIGSNPKHGDLLEFWFAKPTVLKSYKFQSGNYEKKTSLFTGTDIEVYPLALANFTKVGSFDEFGYAAGELQSYGPLGGIRLKVIRSSSEFYKSVLLSEIKLERLEVL